MQLQNIEQYKNKSGCKKKIIKVWYFQCVPKFVFCFRLLPIKLSETHFNRESRIFRVIFSQTPAFCALLKLACWGIICAGSALCRARAAFGNSALRGARLGARSRFGTCWGGRRRWSYIAVCAAAGHQDKRECQNGGKNDWNDLFHVDMLLLPVFFRKYAGFMALRAAVNNAADRPGNHQDSQFSIPDL